VLDSQTGIGMACTREGDRVGAAFGGLGSAEPVFTPAVRKSF